jgi:arylsulfatase A-like enzyme
MSFFILRHFAIFFVFIIFSPLSSLSAAQKPNILVILADDLGFMDTGFTGSDYYETPNIDRLRRGGMAFNNAYAGGASCAPSRACLLSGEYTPRHQVYAVCSTNKADGKKKKLKPVPTKSFLEPSIYALSESLRDNGYTTAMFGKWHLGYESIFSPLENGFQYYFDKRKRGNREDFSCNPEKDYELKRSTSSDPKKNFSLSGALLQYIDSQKVNGDSRPFFAYLAFRGVHTPLKARDESLQKFKSKAMGKYHQNPLYAASIYDLDAAVGEVLDYLDRESLSENTLVIFTSDNGSIPLSPQEPLRGNKGSYYEGGIKVPTIVRWPSVVQANSSSDVPIINLDFYPTFLDIIGDTPKSTLDGESLLPILNGSASTLNRSSIFWHFPGYLDGRINRPRNKGFRSKPVTVVRQGDWKLHLYHEEWLLRKNDSINSALELFNLREDPEERHNVVASNPEKRDALIQQIKDFWERTGADLPKIPNASKTNMLKTAIRSASHSS